MYNENVYVNNTFSAWFLFFILRHESIIFC